MGKSSEDKNRKNPKKVKCDGRTDRRTDGPTDGRTDGPTKRGVESRSTRLKSALLHPPHSLGKKAGFKHDQPEGLRPRSIDSLEASQFSWEIKNI